ncbi:MAG: radical SAM protein [Candidatus Omnitrophota bacterium]
MKIHKQGFINFIAGRFLYYLRHKGVFYAFYRAFAFIVYTIGNGGLRYIFSRFISSKLGCQEDARTILLIAGRLKLSIHPARRCIDLFWNDIKLTQAPGFVTVLNDKRFMRGRLYSNQARWEVLRVLPCYTEIILTWPFFALKQSWQITVQGERLIDWKIDITPKRNISLGEKEAALLVSSDYTGWISSYEGGTFPPIKPTQEGWQDINFWNLSSRSLGVRSTFCNNEYKPAIILEADSPKEDIRPIIRNSDYSANLRALLIQVKPHSPRDFYAAGMSRNILSNSIHIIQDEKIIDQHMLDSKKRLYRQRLPFIEEKMNKKYLTNVLKPVKVVLINLPWKQGNRWGVRAGSRWPHIKDAGEEAYLPFPFFLAYSAAVFLERGVSVRIIDAIAEQIEEGEFVRLVNELEPELLVAEVSTPSLKNDLEILKQISGKHTKIAVCGLDFNIRQPSFLAENNFIDFVIVGEYEYAAFELFQAIQNGRSLQGVSGILYRENNTVRITPARALLEDLDDLPWPLREQLCMERYKDAPGKIAFPSVQMVASRGCPFQCIFCAWPQLMYNSNRYRVRSPAAVVDEMEYLVKERNFKSIYFDDDTFNIDKENVLKFCGEIRERNLVVPWAIMARADTMDEEMLLAMKQSGLYAVKYGLESAEQKLLDNAKKGMDLRHAERMIYATQALGIKIHLTFAFGLPGETQDTIKRTIDYALSFKPDSLQFSIMTPYPGTEYYEALEKKGHIISKDWSCYDGASRSVIRTEFLSPEDLEHAKDEALKKWKYYMRSRRSFYNIPFDRELRVAFRNNIKSKGFVRTVIKSIKYLLNIQQ